MQRWQNTHRACEAPVAGSWGRAVLCGPGSRTLQAHLFSANCLQLVGLARSLARGQAIPGAAVSNADFMYPVMTIPVRAAALHCKRNK